MKLFNFLPVIFCIAAQALPAAMPEADPIPAPVSDSIVSVDAATHNDLQDHQSHNKAILKTINVTLHPLGLNLGSTFSQLLKGLNLDASTNSVDDLLSGLVGDSRRLENQLDNLVKGLLGDLGLGGLVTTSIGDFAQGLKLKPTSSVRQLLAALGL